MRIAFSSDKLLDSLFQSVWMFLLCRTNVANPWRLGRYRTNGTSELVKFVAGLEYSGLRSEVVHTAKICLLDTMDVGLLPATCRGRKWSVKLGRSRKAQKKG
jgi:hypothetical protein